jgi:PBSX family phage terminase large subunit
MWIATEINLHHDNSIKEVFNRTIAAKRRKIFWDLNPDNPNAFIYTDYIDNYEKKAKEGTLLGGYNYEHFTIDDNINIPEERKELIKSQYDKDSIWYIRDILGKRCIAEGLIYRTFADDMSANEGKRFYINHEQLKEKRFQEINIGVDFGGAGSGHAFSASGITVGYKEIVALCTERWKEGNPQKSDKVTQYATNIDPDKLGELFINFVKRVQNTYGYLGHIEYCFMDSAEQTLIRGLKTALEKAGLYNITVRNARKSEINDRIRCVCTLIAQKRFFITEDCESLVKALTTAVWNPKEVTKDERLDDGSSDIDTLDGFEYSFEASMRRLVDANV